MRSPLERRKPFIPVNFFLFLLYFCIENFKETPKWRSSCDEPLCIHHQTSVSHSWLPWVQLNTHPLPRLSWRKFQISYHSSVSIYYVCVKDGNFFSLTQQNTLLYLNRNNKKSLKVTKYLVCVYISLTTL